MITYKSATIEGFDNGVPVCRVDGDCNINDVKPVVGIANGSVIRATDPVEQSMTTFKFDISTKTWVPVAKTTAAGTTLPDAEGVSF